MGNLLYKIEKILDGFREQNLTEPIHVDATARIQPKLSRSRELIDFRTHSWLNSNALKAESL
jgi:hypothetical protein